MCPGDAYWVHLRVIFDLLVLDPWGEGFDIVSGIVKAVGFGIESHVKHRSAFPPIGGNSI